jgi:hypothetical protein
MSPVTRLQLVYALAEPRLQLVPAVVCLQLVYTAKQPCLQRVTGAPRLSRVYSSCPPAATRPMSTACIQTHVYSAYSDPSLQRVFRPAPTVRIQTRVYSAASTARASMAASTARFSGYSSHESRAASVRDAEPSLRGLYSLRFVFKRPCLQNHDSDY